MAAFIEAIAAYGPRLAYNRTATTAELAQTLAGRTGFKHGQVLMLLRELHEVLQLYAEVGTPVTLDGIGRFRPTIQRDGTLRTVLFVDRELAGGVNRLERYRGVITNRANIGLDNEGYRALWDAAHPGDPLEVPRGKEGGAR